MGCESSGLLSHQSLGDNSNKEKTVSLSSGHWRKKLSLNHSRKVYTLDGTIPPNASDGVVALRVFLEDPASIVKFAEFAKRRGKLSLLLCWIEVLEYKKIEGGNGYKLSQGSHIYNKYFKEDAVVQLGIEYVQSRVECDRILSELGRVEADSDAMLPHGLFDKFGQDCLVCIYEQIYVAYRQSHFYDFTLTALQQQTNHVGVDDFDYMEYLGQGSYGVVVHCRKKSTGKHYAMKIQTKIGLLNCFSDCPKRVTYEKEALVKCHHPFIISMDYAFHTPELAIMVTALGTGESLQFVEPISELRTVFYAAEIVLALNHIHSMGMIYRDLKPANVLLNADGHIQLVDMGGVVDVGGRTLGMTVGSPIDVPAAESAILFAPASGNTVMSIYAPGASSRVRPTKNNLDSNYLLGTDNNTRVGVPSSASPLGHNRANSIMGTSGFMAPEMLALLHQDPSEVTGYTCAVDYWSLGVLIYVLVMGRLPFRNNSVEEFAACDNRGEDPSDHARFRQEIASLPDVSPEFKQIVLELLTICEKKRLGSAGIASVKSHPWFKLNEFGAMPWSLLSKKLVKPPGHIDHGPTPDVVSGDIYPSFSAMLVDCNAGGFTDWAPNPDQQKLFETWDYVAPHVLKLEVGTEEEDVKVYAGALEPGAGTLTVSPPDSEFILGGNSHNSSFHPGVINSSANSLLSKSFDFARYVSPTHQAAKSVKRNSGTTVHPLTNSAGESLGSFGTTKNANTIATVGQLLQTLNVDE